MWLHTCSCKAMSQIGHRTCWGSHQARFVPVRLDPAQDMQYRMSSNTAVEHQHGEAGSKCYRSSHGAKCLLAVDMLSRPLVRPWTKQVSTTASGQSCRTWTPSGKEDVDGEFLGRLQFFSAFQLWTGCCNGVAPWVLQRIRRGLLLLSPWQQCIHHLACHTRSTSKGNRADI